MWTIIKSQNLESSSTIKCTSLKKYYILNYWPGLTSGLLVLDFCGWVCFFSDNQFTLGKCSIPLFPSLVIEYLQAGYLFIWQNTINRIGISRCNSDLANEKDRFFWMRLLRHYFIIVLPLYCGKHLTLPYHFWPDHNNNPNCWISNPYLKARLKNKIKRIILQGI